MPRIICNGSHLVGVVNIRQAIVASTSSVITGFEVAKE